MRVEKFAELYIKAVNATSAMQLKNWTMVLAQQLDDLLKYVQKNQDVANQTKNYSNKITNPEALRLAKNLKESAVGILKSVGVQSLPTTPVIDPNAQTPSTPENTPATSSTPPAPGALDATTTNTTDNNNLKYKVSSLKNNVDSFRQMYMPYVSTDTVKYQWENKLFNKINECCIKIPTFIS
jgi:hypothetical protein